MALTTSYIVMSLEYNLIMYATYVTHKLHIRYTFKSINSSVSSHTHNGKKTFINSILLTRVPGFILS